MPLRSGGSVVQKRRRAGLFDRAASRRGSQDLSRRPHRQGDQIFPGILPGGEAGPGGWSRWITGTGPGESSHASLGLPFLRYVLFENPAWDYHSFRFSRANGFDSDVDFADQKLGPIFNNM